MPSLCDVFAVLDEHLPLDSRKLLFQTSKSLRDTVLATNTTPVTLTFTLPVSDRQAGQARASLAVACQHAKEVHLVLQGPVKQGWLTPRPPLPACDMLFRATTTSNTTRTNKTPCLDKITRVTFKYLAVEQLVPEWLARLCTKVTSLYLQHCSFSLCQINIHQLQRCPSITALYLQYGHDGVAQHCTPSHHFSVAAWCAPADKERHRPSSSSQELNRFARHLTALPNLQSLTLDTPYACSSNGCSGSHLDPATVLRASARAWLPLTKLTLLGSACKQGCADLLASLTDLFPGLVELVFDSDYELDDEGLATLTRLDKLRRVQCYGLALHKDCYRGGGRFRFTLALECLDVRTLARLLPLDDLRLEVVKPAQCAGQQVLKLKLSPVIEEAQAVAMAMREGGVPWLRSVSDIILIAPRSHRATLSGDCVAATLDGLTRLTLLSSLTLRSPTITPELIRTITPQLKTWSSLTLQLSSTDLTVDARTMLLPALPSNVSTLALTATCWSMHLKDQFVLMCANACRPIHVHVSGFCPRHWKDAAEYGMKMRGHQHAHITFT